MTFNVVYIHETVMQHPYGKLVYHFTVSIGESDRDLCDLSLIQQYRFLIK